MKQLILGAAMLTAAVAVWPDMSSAQVSCEDDMATVEEKMMQLSNDKQAKATEHLAAAEKAMAENNGDKCIEELHLADDEIEANL